MVQRDYIPAAPGWVARIGLFDDGELTFRYLSIIGWALEEGADYPAEPLVHFRRPGEVLTPGEVEARGRDQDARVDAVFFDPTKVPAEPEIDEDYWECTRLEREEAQAAKRAEVAANE